MQISNSFIPLPRLHCPPEFWPALGYDGTARFVAVGYEQHDDGRISAGGAGSNWWALRLLLQHNNLDMIAYDFGSDDADAEHLLVIDRGIELEHSAMAGYIAPVQDAVHFVAAQWPPRPVLQTPVDWSLLHKAIQETFAELERLSLNERIVQQQDKLAALEAALRCDDVI